jgi:hypothetical protein
MATAIRWRSSVLRPLALPGGIAKRDAGYAGAVVSVARFVMDHALRHEADRDLSREDQPPGRRVLGR